jgi:hypothetical protein
LVTRSSTNAGSSGPRGGQRASERQMELSSDGSSRLTKARSSEAKLAAQLDDE